MHFVIYLTFFLLQFIFSMSNVYAVSLNESSEKLILMQGEQRSLPKGSSLWIENSNVLKATETESGFTIKGLKSGFSEVKIGRKTIEVNVLTLDQVRTHKVLSNAITQTLSLKIEIENGLILVRGNLVRWKDWQMLAKSCTEITCQYTMEAKISEELIKECEQKINHDLNSHSLPSQKIDFSERPQIHLPPKSSLTKSVEKALAPYGIHIEHDSNAIELAPLVKVQITVAEVSKEFNRIYGVKWSDSYRAQVMPPPETRGTPTYADVMFWEKSGLGKVLASPNILCRSGKDAEFLAGGEFPIKLINFKTQDVIWKQYGILLKVKPVADFSGRMSISIQTEVSSIDASRVVDGIPGLHTNRVQSHFDLTKPKTIALSGLIKNEFGENADGLAFLSKIPILGSLFSSKNFQNNKTELVIFVRPEIINTDQIPDEQDNEKNQKFFSDKTEEV